MIFQSVALNASLSDTSMHNVVFLEDSVATVSETGTLYVSMINLTSNPQRVRCGVQLGTVVPVSLVYQAVPQSLGSSTTTSKETNADNGRANFVCKVYSEMNLSTASELTSSQNLSFYPQLILVTLSCKMLRIYGALAPASPSVGSLMSSMIYS